jgi:hypothetical protein
MQTSNRLPLFKGFVMDIPKRHSNVQELWTNLSPTAPPLDYLKLYEAGQLRKPTEDQLISEVQLLSLGDYFPLSIEVDVKKLMADLVPYKDKWSPYLPREGRTNNREGLCLVGLEGDSYTDSFSIPEARMRTGKPLLDSDFNVPTQLFNDCPSLHPFLNYFMPLGRTMLIKVNEGGWFAPHRDGRWIFRDSFRLIVFCQNCSGSVFNWYMNGKSIDIEEGRVYYVNTRLEHRTISYVNDSIHLIVNVPVTLENVLKLLTYT